MVKTKEKRFPRNAQVHLDSVPRAASHLISAQVGILLPVIVLLEASRGPAPLSSLRRRKKLCGWQSTFPAGPPPDTPTDSPLFPPFYRNGVPCRAVLPATSSVCLFLYSLSFPPSHQQHYVYSVLHKISPVRYLPDTPFSFYLHSMFSRHLLDTQSGLSTLLGALLVRLLSPHLLLLLPIPSAFDFILAAMVAAAVPVTFSLFPRCSWQEGPFA